MGIHTLTYNDLYITRKTLNFDSCFNSVFKFIGSTVIFAQSTYNAAEDDGLVQPVLVLSYPSSTDITVQVNTSANSATGEYLNSVHLQ